MKHHHVNTQFEKEEIDAIRSYLGELPPVELKAIVLRFWGRYTIADIAGEIRKSWDEADQILERAIKRLKVSCLKDPVFLAKLFRDQAA